jgi:hypothetical protein
MTAVEGGLGTLRQPDPAVIAAGASTSPVALVVVGAGPQAAFHGSDAPTELAARRLAKCLSLPHRSVPDPARPHRQLQQLQDAAGGWFASLPLDPGQALADGSTWAEALGAWQQPTLLIIGSQQLASGAPASTMALLCQWKVPCLGLVQWGGPWFPEARRRDGLPWLGRLDEGGGAEADAAASTLAWLVLQRWTLLDLPGKAQV